MAGKALILLTSHGVLGRTGKPTGFHWVEMATPYFALKDAGWDITFGSPVGGRPPSDPASSDPDSRAADVDRFLADADAMGALERTTPLSDLRGEDYDVVYVPGGHGTMWDLAQDNEVCARIVEAWEAGAIVGSVCHGPAAFTECYLTDGTPLVEGRKVVAFTDAEEKEAELDTVVPFLLETRLRALGAKFECNPENYGEHVVRDGRLVTGQNPASVPVLTRTLLDAAEMRRVA